MNISAKTKIFSKIFKGTTFVNISAKTKIFSKIFKGVNLVSRYYGFMKKTRLRKSHATVPLKKGVGLLRHTEKII